MSIFFVDQYASGAGDGTSWTDAWTSLSGITGISAGDEVRIKSYGPDDAYTAGITSVAGAVYTGDDGTGGEVPSYRMVYIEPTVGDGVGTNPCTCRYIAVKSPAGGEGFNITASSAYGTMIEHCRVEACSTRGINIIAGEDAEVIWTEDYDGSSFWYFVPDGSAVVVQHCTLYSIAGTSGVVYVPSIFTGSTDYRSLLLLSNEDTLNLLIKDGGSYVSGSPDYNHTDVASAGALYSPDLSSTPANDSYGVSAAAYLPYAGYGILYPTRGFPGERAGHDGMDVGAHSHEYAIECLASYDAQTDGTTKDENGSQLNIGVTSAGNTRAVIGFDIENLPAQSEVKEIWMRTEIAALSSSASHTYYIVPYAGLGKRDPDDDSASETYGYCDDGPKLTPELDDMASGGSTGDSIHLLDIDYSNLLIEEQRQAQQSSIWFSLYEVDGDDDAAVIYGSAEATTSRRPRLVVVYRQGATEEDMLQEALDALEIVFAQRV